MQVVMIFTLGMWTCLWNIQTALGDYNVSVRLLEYSRDQDCQCDPGSWRCYECDVYFQICLQPLAPTQGQICQGKNSDYRVDDTHHFLFASVLRGHDIYSWSSVRGQPTFVISVHAFDHDSGWVDYDLGVTNYTYRGNTPTVQTVTTTPGNKNLRIKLELTVVSSLVQTPSVYEVTSSTDTKTNEYSTAPPSKPETLTPDTSYQHQSVTSSECVDLHDSCAEFDLVYGFCHAPPHVSPLLYRQAHEECRRTCNFC